MSRRKGAGAFRSNAPRKQLLRSIFLFSSTVCNFMALKFLPITVTTTIAFAGPIAVTLLAIPILGERVGLRRILAVCVGFLGVLVVIQPWGTEFHPAMFFSLAALVLASMYFIMTRMLAGIETNATQQVWSSAHRLGGAAADRDARSGSGPTARSSGRCSSPSAPSGRWATSAPPSPIAGPMPRSSRR